MSSSAQRRSRLEPGARRAQLLDCALAVFARDGLGRANHAAVARAAGVSVATAFHYFPSREELLDAVLKEVESFFVGLASEIHARDATLPEILVAHGEAFLGAADAHGDYVRVWLDWSTAIRESVWPRYLEFQERLIAIVAASVERGRARGQVPADVDAEDTARLFVGNAHMAALMKFAPNSGLDLNHLVRRAVTALLVSAPTRAAGSQR
jgi:TetR/AcrR family hemagglutinin/protease transcriptional regulator